MREVVVERWLQHDAVIMKTHSSKRDKEELHNVSILSYMPAHKAMAL